MGEIQLANGKGIAVVDTADHALVDGIAWYRHGRYAAASLPGGAQKVFMHRHILGDSAGGLFVDHIDHDGLNNSRANLRICDGIGNARNRNARLSTANSGLMGVYTRRDGRSWFATISVLNRTRYLGDYSSRDAAYAARVAAERILFGDFAPRRVEEPKQGPSAYAMGFIKKLQQIVRAHKHVVHADSLQGGAL